MSDQPFRVTQVFNQTTGPLPQSGNFESGGGTLILFASGTVFATAGSSIGFKIEIDGELRGQAQVFSNEMYSHRAVNANALVVTGLAAGKHSLSIDRLNTETASDQNDYFSVTVLELPQ